MCSAVQDEDRVFVSRARAKSAVPETARDPAIPLSSDIDSAAAAFLGGANPAAGSAAVDVDEGHCTRRSHNVAVRRQSRKMCA